VHIVCRLTPRPSKVQGLHDVACVGFIGMLHPTFNFLDEFQGKKFSWFNLQSLLFWSPSEPPPPSLSTPITHPFGQLQHPAGRFPAGGTIILLAIDAGLAEAASDRTTARPYFSSFK